MLIEIASVVTAFATACSAIYLAFSYRDERARRAPAIRVHGVSTEDGCAIVHFSIYPTDHHLLIKRITSNAAGVGEATYSQSEWGAISTHPAKAHFESMEVNWDLLPAHVASSKVFSRYLSVKLRKDQRSVQISFHRSLRRFATRHSITAMIKSETD